ncbi:hypothetical protein T492DRAFT_1018960 [Pavlovales sp. CCMP2436]|nr:hypothetical protein T492DRAFT_1018960 [Pavlovales sp. CCMP2436]
MPAPLFLLLLGAGPRARQAPANGGIPAWRALQGEAAQAEAEGWRALQGDTRDEAESAQRAHGSPPCLRNLRKVGSGHNAAWHLATFEPSQSGGVLSRIDVLLALDANPTEPCLLLNFVHADGADGSKRTRVGHILLACGPSSSALRGMFVREELRGQGLSRVLLAVWLRLCASAQLSPTTQQINKPLLARSLEHFGFVPANRAFPVELKPPPPRPGEVAVAQRTAFTRTRYQPPRDAAQLDAAIDVALAGGRVSLAPSCDSAGTGGLPATSNDLACALTLRPLCSTVRIC